jgi:hypothetical protein
VYVALPGTEERMKEGRMSIPIPEEQQLSVIGGTLDSAERQEEER